MSITKINGINLDYTVSGQGYPLVMIMGMGIGQKGWRFQKNYFSRYFRTITFDNRGCGESDKPEEAYTTRMMAADTIGLLDYLKIEKAHFLGVSMGGMIAQEIAINYPDRVNKLVLGCTICRQDGAANGDTPEFNQAADSALLGDLDPMLNLLFNKRLIKMLFIPIIKKSLKKAGTAGVAGLAGQRQACLNHNTMDRLGLIKAPALVIGGTADRVIITSSWETLSKLIPGAQLKYIDNGSHSMFVEMPKRFNREVYDFLSK
jgi:3-oxoadipate enol-lactonase